MGTLKTLLVNAPSGLREQVDRITGRMALVRHLAALRPGVIDTTTASTKAGRCRPRSRDLPRRVAALGRGELHVDASELHRLAGATERRLRAELFQLPAPRARPIAAFLSRAGALVP